MRCLNRNSSLSCCWALFPCWRAGRGKQHTRAGKKKDEKGYWIFIPKGFFFLSSAPTTHLSSGYPSAKQSGTRNTCCSWSSKCVARQTGVSELRKKNKKKDIDLCMKLLQNVILGCCCSLSNTAPITRPSLPCSSSSVTYNSSVLFISHSVHFGGRQIRSRLLWKVRN